jgi:penicillin amidase
MKILKIIIYSILSVLIIAVVAGLIIITTIKRAALPQYKGEIKLSGLTAEVTSYRDERGIPHIYASNEHDLYFAVGYIMAQERLWQMDFLRRVTKGRVSEIIGEKAVQYDLFQRSLDITNKSKAIMAAAEPEITASIGAFSDGVNRYISDAGNKLPPEFKILGYKPEPWMPEDCANIIGYMSWDLAYGALYEELFNYELVKKFGIEKTNRLIPDWRAVSSLVYPDFSLDEKALKQVREMLDNIGKIQPAGINIFSGSNNWAVTGRRSETGKPVMLNDMHLPFGSPGIWMQMHQVIEGKLNVTGVVVPCQPFVVAGHNEKIAWGETNLMVDGIDLYLEKINPADSNQYFFNGEWKNMIVRDEVIKIKGGTEKILKLRFTHRGTVISDLEKVKDAVISMRWSGYDPSNEIRAVYLLNRATGWDDFRTAICHFRAASQNFAYADVEGNIGLNTGGGIPVRKGNGTIIRNGETDEFDWKGYVPFEQLPFSLNPDTGSVSSANNRTVSEDYPYFISADFDVPYRINRIRQMLGEKQVFGIEDFKRMVTDQHSDYAALLTPEILESGNMMMEFSDAEKSAFNALKSWDFDMNKDLVAPTIFEFFRPAFAKNLLGDELGDLYDRINGTTREYYIYRILTQGADEWVDDVSTPEKETLEDILLKSFKDAVSDLQATAGSDTTGWKWGKIHTIVLEHPLGTVKVLDRIFSFNSKEYPVGGSSHTVSPYTYTQNFKTNHGASERHIFNTADWDESLTVIPTGISGVPASEFYLSQTDSYINGRYYKDHFSEKAVKANAKYTLVLKPE